MIRVQTKMCILVRKCPVKGMDADKIGSFVAIFGYSTGSNYLYRPVSLSYKR
jgi:hypothetical protein